MMERILRLGCWGYGIVDKNVCRMDDIRLDYISGMMFNGF